MMRKAFLVRDAEGYILALHLAFFLLFSSSLQPMFMPVFRMCLPSQVSLPGNALIDTPMCLLTVDPFTHTNDTCFFLHRKLNLS